MSLVYTLLAEIGRVKGDGLPEGALGGAFLLFAPGDDEEGAVRDAVRLLEEAGLNPLEITNYGDIAAREKSGYEFSPEERALAQEAQEENAVIILDKTVFYDEDDDGKRN